MALFNISDIMIFDLNLIVCCIPEVHVGAGVNKFHPSDLGITFWAKIPTESGEWGTHCQVLLFKGDLSDMSSYSGWPGFQSHMDELVT